MNILRTQLLEKSMEINLLKHELKSWWHDDIRNKSSTTNVIISDQHKIPSINKTKDSAKILDEIKEINNNKINPKKNNFATITTNVPNNTNLIIKKNTNRTFKIVSKKNNPLLIHTNGNGLNGKLDKELKEISSPNDNFKNS